MSGRRAIYSQYRTGIIVAAILIGLLAFRVVVWLLLESDVHVGDP